MAPLFDAHNHLQDAWLATERVRALADLASVGVRACVVNGTDEADWDEVATLCGKSETMRVGENTVALLPSFGLHPWHAGNRSPHWQANLRAQLDRQPSAFIGEIGLDRWITDRARPDDARLAGLRRAPIEEQLEVFRFQLELAAERNVPATIHCLEAFGALLEALQRGPAPAAGFLLHAYSGPAEMVGGFAKLGAYFSFNGAFLDPRKSRLRDVYATIPADRLLVETDAPAMSPPLDRERFHLPNTVDGERVNHPANIVVAYEALAEIRRTSVEALRASVAENFARLFGHRLNE